MKINGQWQFGYGALSIKGVNGPTQLLNCQWNSSGIDDSQMLKYQSSEPQTYIFS